MTNESICRAALLVVVFSFISCNSEFQGIKDIKEPALAADETRPTYASIREKILVPKCLSCHSGPNSPHGLDLSTFEGVMGQKHFPPLIVPGHPDRSSLYTVVKSGAMPKMMGRLSEKDILAISTWIKNGANEHEGVPNPIPSATPTGEPGGDDEPGSPIAPITNEPCDKSFRNNEPGVMLCSTSEPNG